ncbi:SDR family oxidoreductase [Streptomyces sp. SID11385]|uniref:glucose 1-dehydrogenase n=1 Tax=Streptomyces sp. SID11385 TaxID=2706031 RepID=UPI0019410016
MTYLDLRDKAALVTGGAGGIGEAAAGALLAEGAKVAIVDISAAALAETAAALGAEDGRLLTIAADVSKEDDVKAYVQATVDAFGTIDVFFNNAGIEGRVAPLVEQEVEDLDRVLAVNVRGSFLGLKHVLPVMYAKKAGSVINTSSIGGLSSVTTGTSPYSASKFAITGLTRVSALESAPYGVRVNSVHPGVTDTKMLRRLAAGHAGQGSGADTGGTGDEGGISVPLGRQARPSDIANTVLFLASDASSFATGAQFLIDGGTLA